MYALLYAREIVETLIRFEAHDATAIHKILTEKAALSEYARAHIEVKMEALTALNRRISSTRPRSTDRGDSIPD